MQYWKNSEDCIFKNSKSRGSPNNCRVPANEFHIDKNVEKQRPSVRKSAKKNRIGLNYKKNVKGF